MSEEEQFESIIQEIKEIYIMLTQQEPTPDDEIKARENLLNKVQLLKAIDSPKTDDNISLFEETLIKLENWDTLELWFIESDLPDFIKRIINITEELPEIIPEEEYKEYDETPTTKLREDLETASVDIEEIVDKVSKQFKGEIQDLKKEIDVLKLELEKKDEISKKGSQMKVIKKITPKRDVKLPPPKIKIPVIGKPDKAPQIKAPRETEIEKPKKQIELDSIKQVQLKIEEEIEKLKVPLDEKTEIEQEKIPPEEKLESKSKLTEPEIISETPKEKESISDLLKEEETSQAKPISEMISELPEKPPSISEVLKESDKSSKSAEPSEFTEMPQKPKKSKVISEIIEVDTEEEKEIPFTIKEPKIIEKPKDIEKPESIKKPQIIAQKPKITPVSVEEIETESIPSTGTDLFNVFSSVGEKTDDKLPSTDETLSSLSVKEKKKKEEKKKKKDDTIEPKKTNAVSFVGFDSSKTKRSVTEELDYSSYDELPADKDSLYQELIALEGRRYSLEKNFKEIEKSYATGSIDDIEYNKQSDKLRGKLDSITSRINNIRRVISSL